MILLGKRFYLTEIIKNITVCISNCITNLEDKAVAIEKNVVDDIEFEMELIKQVEINIDYILMLIRNYHESNQKDREIIVNIQTAIDSSIDLRNKKELIEEFVDQKNKQGEIISEITPNL